MTTITQTTRTPFVTNLLDTPQRTHYTIKLPSVRGTDCVVDFMADRLRVPTFRTVRHDRSEVVDCANLASARAIAEGRAPNKVDIEPQRTLKVKAFVSPTGQYYVMHGNQRMDVANAQTARHYARHGVAVETMLEASLSTLNQ
tara:strand:+ start:259 stop:687 length:429 start_codon:yes stop_codon:yes gene_type:complete